MPLVIISGYFMLRFSYQRALSGEEVGPPGYYPEDLPIQIKAAESVAIGSVYWVWLIVYYTLGVYFRKKTGGTCRIYVGCRLNHSRSSWRSVDLAYL